MYFEMVDFIDWLVNNTFATFKSGQRRGTIFQWLEIINFVFLNKIFIDFYSLITVYFNAATYCPAEHNRF